MALDLDALATEVQSFLTVRHLATLTVLRADGSPHVSPVGFTYDVGTRTARVITSAGARKAILAAADSRVSICQVDGGQWLTLEGRATVSSDPNEVAEAVARYADRYRVPRENPLRVAIVIQVDRIMGRVALAS